MNIFCNAVNSMLIVMTVHLLQRASDALPKSWSFRASRMEIQPYLRFIIAVIHFIGMFLEIRQLRVAETRKSAFLMQGYSRKELKE